MKAGQRIKAVLFVAMLSGPFVLGVAQQTAAFRGAPPQESGAFVGRWKLIDHQGRINAYLTITRAAAKREHAAGSCVPEDLGYELRLAWPDGFRDVAAFDELGNPVLRALERHADDWSGPARFTLRMERR